MGATGKDELEKVKQKRGRGKSPQKRKKNVRERQVRFLIVCEGTKTEPNYFRALLRNNTSRVIDEEIRGEGQGASDLVDKAVKIKESLEKRNAMSFDRVWVVFDKDDRTDFNKAIDKANKLGFKSAWSNESFELWFCLHFEYLHTPIGRSDYIKKLEKISKRERGIITLSTRKVVLIFTSCLRLMVMRILPRLMLKNYVHYIMMTTMQNITPARWLTCL